LGVAATTTQDNYFVVWEDHTNFHSGRDTIVARHFDTTGNALTGDVVVNPLNDFLGHPFFAFAPAATRLPLPGGQADGLAVAFTNNYLGMGADFDTYVVRTTANLVRLENFLPIDVSGATTIDPSITSFNDGSLVVAYTYVNSSTDWDIFARTISPTGTV